MSTTVAPAVYDAFAQSLSSFASGFSPPLPVGFPGVPFVPPGAGLWLEAAFFPNETANYGIGVAGPFLHQGFLQASVCARPGGGVLGAMEVAAELANYFRKGTQVGPAKVERPPSIVGSLVDPNRVAVPVSIPYRAFLTDADA